MEPGTRLSSLSLQQSDSFQAASYVIIVSSVYFGLTEPWLGCEEFVTGLVSNLQCDVLEELEHLYIPLVLRFVVM